MDPIDLPSHAVFQPQKRLFDAINEKRDFLGQSQVKTEPDCTLIMIIIIKPLLQDTCLIITLFLFVVLFCCLCCCLQTLGAKDFLNSYFL